MSEAVICAESLCKRYGDVVAVAGVDFDVARGECFGLLGVNGAGKTSIVRMVQCVSPRSSGRLQVLGFDAADSLPQLKARIGVVPQDNNLDPDLDVTTNLRVYARYFGIGHHEVRSRIGELLDFFDLGDRARSPIQRLSGGMRRRLVLARAMINSPELLLLDEPTTGLDPQARHWVWSRLRSLRGAGVTMLLTTHYMREAAQLCDRVAVIDAGELLAVGPPDSLVLEHVGERCIEIRPLPSERLRARQLLEDLDAKSLVAGDTIYIYPSGGIDLTALAAIPHERLLERSATLEDLFLCLTGRELIV